VAVAGQYAGTIAPYVLHVWAHHSNDPQLTENVKDIIKAFAQNPQGFASMYPSLQPTLSDVLKSPEKLPNMVEAAVDIFWVAITVRSDVDPVPKMQSNLVEDLGPHLVELLLKTEDTSLLKSGADCLTAIVRRLGAQLGSRIPQIAQIAARLLDPTLSDLTSASAGPLVTSLVTLVADQLGPALPELLRAVVMRLTNSRLPVLTQSLVLVFARLANTHMQAVFDFLSSVVVNSQDGLSFVLGYWTKYHLEFNGDLGLKVSLDGLAKVFHSADPRLDAIYVPGDLVVDVNSARASRSKKKDVDKWTTVPLRLKILQIILKDHQLLELKPHKTSTDEEDDDENEDAEDDEDDEADDDLDNLLDLADEDDEWEDPYERLDPLYNVDIQKYIQDWIKALANDPQKGPLLKTASQYLHPDLQKQLNNILYAMIYLHHRRMHHLSTTAAPRRPRYCCTCSSLNWRMIL